MPQRHAAGYLRHGGIQSLVADDFARGRQNPDAGAVGSHPRACGAASDRRPGAFDAIASG
jgi:hypothetical protein